MTKQVLEAQLVDSGNVGGQFSIALAHRLGVRLSVMIRSLTAIKRIQLALVPVLVFWVGGGGCILGCSHQALSAANDDPTTIHQSPAQHGLATILSNGSASSGHHSCCFRRQASSLRQRKKGAAGQVIESGSLALLSVSNELMQQCPLGLNGPALFTKARPDQSPAATAAASPRLPSIEVNKCPSFATTPTFHNNRGHTYLRCCVFLI